MEETATAAKPGKTVLIADDSRFFRSMLSYALDEEGYRCLSAGSGEEALEMAGRELPGIDLFIFDLVMPGVNGIALVEQLRKIPGAEKIPVIVATQYGVNALERNLLAQHGVETVLPKTVSIERILYEVREALHPEDRNRREQPRVPASVAVTVRAPGRVWITSTFNLSEGGMFLALPDGESPREGTEVKLKFWIPDEAELFELEGKVVWVNPLGPGAQRSHPPGFGVLFVAAPDSARLAIGTYLSR